MSPEDVALAEAVDLGTVDPTEAIARVLDEAIPTGCNVDVDDLARRIWWVLNY